MGRRERSNDRIAEKKIIETLQATKSQTKTSRLLHIGFNQVHRVMHQAVALGLRRRSPEERYYYLSIDEKAVQRGHNFRGQY